MNVSTRPIHARNLGYVLPSSPKLFSFPAQNPALHRSSPRPILYRTCSTPNLRTVFASVTPKTQQVRIYTNTDSTPVQKLAASLASAFEQDPLFNYISPSKGLLGLEKKRKILESILKLELSRPSGENTVHVSEDNGTVALWHHVGHWKMPLYMQLQLALSFFTILGWDALRFINAMQVVEEVHPTEPHMHLSIIGTDEATRGRGNGSTVISKMLHQCDQHGTPVYVESSNENNLSFYRKHGFELLRKVPGLPDDCPPIFAMWRIPQPVQEN